MKKIALTDLNAEFVAHQDDISEMVGRPSRQGVGVMFNCPCGCPERLVIPFSNPIDGLPPHAVGVRGPLWQRDGNDLGTLSLEQSILRAKQHGGCGWHGWVKDGYAVFAAEAAK